MTRVALALLLIGCADHAILELTLELPAAVASCDAQIARVDARLLAAEEATCPVAASEWRGDALDVPLEAAPATVIVDVVADAPEVDARLCVRVRPCATPGCPSHDALLDPSVVAQLARPFHRGERTRWTLAFADPCASADLGVIDACAIGGCTEEVLATYCRDDGAHLCEP